MRKILGFLAALVLLFPDASSAQAVQATPAVSGVFVDLNVIDAGTYFAKHRHFTGLFARFGEQGRFEATYPKPSRGSVVPVDIAAGVFGGTRLAVGVGVSRTSLGDTALVIARVPHPTFFNAPATATTESGELRRVETAVNLSAVVVPVRTSRIEWRVSAGPSYFWYSADMVQGVVYSQTAPVGTSENVVSIDSVTTAAVRAHVLGLHLGSDVAIPVGGRLAIIGGVRFSSGVVHLKREPLSGIGQDIRVGRKAILLGVRVHLKKAR